MVTEYRLWGEFGDGGSPQGLLVCLGHCTHLSQHKPILAAALQTAASKNKSSCHIKVMPFVNKTKTSEKLGKSCALHYTAFVFMCVVHKCG